VNFLIHWLLRLQILNPVVKPAVRLFVGIIAVPIFRSFIHRVVRSDDLDRELTKDLEQWFRGSLLLLVATANMEAYLFGELLNVNLEHNWIPLVMRLLLAVGVIETMPDQALFAIIYPGPGKLLLPKKWTYAEIHDQLWPFVKGLFYRHIDRTSSVFAIVAAIKSGPVGWTCYGLAIFQFLVIGLMCSKEKAIDVLTTFDQQIILRRQELIDEVAEESRAEGNDPAHVPGPTPVADRT